MKDLGELGQAALRYAQSGIAVFPCRPKNKQPLTKTGFKEATCDLAQVERWWTVHPDANIGTPTGARFDVVDLDGEEAERALAGIVELSDFPVVVRTPRPGGRHLYVRPEGRGNAVALAPNVDYRGAGGYVILPPSRVDLPGKYSGRYEFERGDLAECIPGLPPAPNLQSPPMPISRAAKKPKRGDAIPEGSRNDTLFREACSLAAKGLDRTEMLTVLLESNDRCSPPLPESEVAGLCDSALRYASTWPATPDYVLINGRTFKRKSGGDGGLVLLADFEARIVEQIQVHGSNDGEGSPYFRIEGRTQDRVLAPVEVAAAEFDGMAWTAQWGVDAVIAPGPSKKAELAHAIKCLSLPNVRRGHRFSVLGWRKIEGEWVFVHAGGGLRASGADPTVDCRVPSALERYRMADPSSGEELAEGCRASLRLLDMRDDEVSFPLYLAMLRSVLGPARFTVHVFGPTGQGKTYSVLYLLRHFGAWTENSALVRAASTYAGLEACVHAVGDLPLLVDDFKGNMSEKDKAAFATFLQCVGDGSGRSRGTVDQGMREGKPPRGLVLTTGEEAVPGEASTFARTFSIRMVPRKGHVDAGRDWMRECGEPASKAMSAYLCHVAGRLDQVRSGHARESGDIPRVLFPSEGGHHPRTLETCAELLAALSPWLDFCVSAGAIGSEQALVYRQRAERALERAVASQQAAQQDEDPVEALLSHTLSVLRSNQAHLKRIDGKTAGLESWGWTDSEREPNTPLVGWLDEGRGLVHLLVEPWLGAVRKQAQAAGKPFTVRNDEVLRRALDQGHIRRGSEKDKAAWSSRVSVDGSRTRVVSLELSSLQGEDADSSTHSVDLDGGDDPDSPQDRRTYL